MKVLQPVWVWERAIPLPLIDLLMSDAAQRESIDGELYGGKKDTSIRKSSLVQLEPIHWFAGVLHNHAMYANSQMDWRRTVTFPELCQIAYYRPGEFYDWHMDSHVLNNEPTIRKLTTICFLTEPTEYEGGELQIKHTDLALRPPKGTIVVFPSVLDHRVTPVTSGLRISATTWSHGPNVW